jgi:archaeosortase C (PEF-CTERM variant)
MALALFLGATVEYGHGSGWIGLLLISFAIVLLFKIKFTSEHVYKSSKLLALLGFLIILADIGYNYYFKSQLGTLDTMTLFFGASLTATAVKNDHIRKMSSFGMYTSMSFIILFVLFYNLFPKLGFEFVRYFDQYLVVIPSAYLGNMIGVPVEVLDLESVFISGKYSMQIRIGAACSGLYSILLLISIVISYAITEGINAKGKIFKILGFSILAAWAGNLARITTLFYIAANYGKDTMMTVHVNLGWIIFAIVAVIVMYLLTRIKNPDFSHV